MKVFDLRASIGEERFSIFLKLSGLNALTSLMHGGTQIIYKDYFFKNLDLIKSKDMNLYDYLLDIAFYNDEFKQTNEILL